MKSLIGITSILSLSFFAQAKPSEHRELGAHQHGMAALAIAFDGLSGKIEFRGAAEGILGFEHRPRSPKDKAAVASAAKHFETDMGKIVRFESALSCQFKKDLIGQVPEKGEEGSGEHSDWAANFSVTCAKSPAGTKLIIDFGSFKLLKDVDVTVLVGQIQKSAEFKKEPVVIDLK